MACLGWTVRANRVKLRGVFRNRKQTQKGVRPSRQIPARALTFGAAGAAALVVSFTGAGDPTGFRVAAVLFFIVVLQALWSSRRGAGATRLVEDESDVAALLSEERALLYKHSTACMISADALAEVADFARAHPGIPVYQVRVLESRSLSDELARRLEVRHHSPQLILVARGVARDQLSHGAIRRRAIERLVGVGSGTPDGGR